MDFKSTLVLGAFTFLSCSTGFAQESNNFYYVKNQDCWVKKYSNGNFSLADDSIFGKTPLKTQSLKRNPQFRAFKYNGEMYMAHEKCFEPEHPGFENELLVESEKEAPKEIDRSKSQTKNIKKKTYFVELGGQLQSVGSKGQIYPSYETDLLGKTFGTISVSSVGNVAVSKYKTQNGINFSIGSKMSESYDYIFKFELFKANKTESVPVNSGAKILLNTFEDRISNLLVGAKFHFSESKRIKPYTTAALGVSSLNSTMTFENSKSYDLGSSSLAASIDIGLDYFFNDTYALGTKIGYEWLGHKELRIKDSNSSDGSGLSNLGFATNMNYSYLYLNLGISFYWN